MLLGSNRVCMKMTGYHDLFILCLNKKAKEAKPNNADETCVQSSARQKTFTFYPTPTFFHSHFKAGFELDDPQIYTIIHSTTGGGD